MVCSEEIASGAVCTFTATFMVPNEPGAFVTYLQITDSSNQLFGPKVWCNIVAEEPAAEAPEEEKVDPAQQLANP